MFTLLPNMLSQICSVLSAPLAMDDFRRSLRISLSRWLTTGRAASAERRRPRVVVSSFPVTSEFRRACRMRCCFSRRDVGAPAAVVAIELRRRCFCGARELRAAAAAGGGPAGGTMAGRKPPGGSGPVALGTTDAVALAAAAAVAAAIEARRFSFRAFAFAFFDIFGFGFGIGSSDTDSIASSMEIETAAFAVTEPRAALLPVALESRRSRRAAAETSACPSPPAALALAAAAKRRRSRRDNTGASPTLPHAALAAVERRRSRRDNTGDTGTSPPLPPAALAAVERRRSRRDNVADIGFADASAAAAAVERRRSRRADGLPTAAAAAAPLVSAAALAAAVELRRSRRDIGFVDAASAAAAVERRRSRRAVDFPDAAAAATAAPLAAAIDVRRFRRARAVRPLAAGAEPPLVSAESEGGGGACDWTSGVGSGPLVPVNERRKVPRMAHHKLDHPAIRFLFVNKKNQLCVFLSAPPSLTSHCVTIVAREACRNPRASWRMKWTSSLIGSLPLTC